MSADDVNAFVEAGIKAADDEIEAALKASGYHVTRIEKATIPYFYIAKKNPKYGVLIINGHSGGNFFIGTASRAVWTQRDGVWGFYDSDYDNLLKQFPKAVAVYDGGNPKLPWPLEFSIGDKHIRIVRDPEIPVPWGETPKCYLRADTIKECMAGGLSRFSLVILRECHAGADSAKPMQQAMFDAGASVYGGSEWAVVDPYEEKLAVSVIDDLTGWDGKSLSRKPLRLNYISSQSDKLTEQERTMAMHGRMEPFISRNDIIFSTRSEDRESGGFQMLRPILDRAELKCIGCSQFDLYGHFGSRPGKDNGHVYISENSSDPATGNWKAITYDAWEKEWITFQPDKSLRNFSAYVEVRGRKSNVIKVEGKPGAYVLSPPVTVTPAPDPDNANGTLRPTSCGEGTMTVDFHNPRSEYVYGKDQLEYTQWQATLNWSLPPIYLSPGDTFNIAVKGSGAVTKPGINVGETMGRGVEVCIRPYYDLKNGQYLNSAYGEKVWSPDDLDFLSPPQLWNADGPRPYILLNAAATSWPALVDLNEARQVWGINRTFSASVPTNYSADTIRLDIYTDGCGTTTYTWVKAKQ